MAQRHTAEDDIAFAASLEPMLRDPRYIRINGRPLLMLYRPGLLPDAAATVRRWRAHFQAAGLCDPYLVMPLAGGTDDPRQHGMDAAAGFPPHRTGFNLAPVREGLELLDPAYRGTVVRYADMVANRWRTTLTNSAISPASAQAGTTKRASRGRASACRDQRPRHMAPGSRQPVSVCSRSRTRNTESCSLTPGMNGPRVPT